MDNNLKAISETIANFVAERDWDQFHSPKNLSMALIAEVAELIEHFQWLTEEESRNLTDARRAAVRLELADIFIYLLRLADKLNINLIDAARDKIELNRLKYPVDLVKGSSRRADEYK